MALQPWQDLSRDPQSPMRGWSQRALVFGGDAPPWQFPPAQGGDASQDVGLLQELQRQRRRQEDRLARVADANQGVIDREYDLSLNPLGGGGVGGRDRVEMSHVISQDVPPGPQNVRPGAVSRQPRRFHVC
jgi:hypothetical protein